MRIETSTPGISRFGERPSLLDGLPAVGDSVVALDRSGRAVFAATVLAASSRSGTADRAAFPGEGASRTVAR
jgi:hypothetical protein